MGRDGRTDGLRRLSMRGGPGRTQWMGNFSPTTVQTIGVSATLISLPPFPHRDTPMMLIKTSQSSFGIRSKSLVTTKSPVEGKSKTSGIRLHFRPESCCFEFRNTLCTYPNLRVNRRKNERAKRQAALKDREARSRRTNERT